MNNGMSLSQWHANIYAGTSRISFAGYATIFVFLGAFAYWAATAPLSGAAVAPGVVAAAGLNIVVQHLEGGIVREIKVGEGDRVAAGAPLVELDTTTSAALLNRLTNQHAALSMRATRLEAERDLVSDVEIKHTVNVSGQGSYLLELASEQEKEFYTRRTRYIAEREILHQRVKSLEEAIVGLISQRKAGEEQLSVVRDEMIRKKNLLEQGLTNRSEYTALLQTEAELVGRNGALQAQIASSSTQIVEARQQVERATTQRVEQAITELNEVRGLIADLEEQIDAATSVLDRTTIRSPVDGIIVRKLVNSWGSVVRAGDPVVEVLPTTPELVIEARLSPLDIDTVYVGQSAELVFTALNTRTTSRVGASVTYISADRLIDSSDGQPFFVARLRITDDLPREVVREDIAPGMPVQAYFVRKERTFFQYLVEPIRESFSNAFLEE